MFFDERSTILLGVRLTPNQRQVLETAARQEGVTLSELTRRALAQYLGNRTRVLFVSPPAGPAAEQEVNDAQ